MIITIEIPGRTKSIELGKYDSAYLEDLVEDISNMGYPVATIRYNEKNDELFLNVLDDDG